MSLENVELAETIDAIEPVSLPEAHIETVFKVVPPVRAIKGGYGYLGVILRNTITDEVQCHICGKWFKSLGAHVRRHGLTARRYRLKYGLPLNFGLCGVDHSHTLSLIAKETMEEYPHILKKGRKKYRGKAHTKNNASSFKYGFKNPARQNKYGFCEEQIIRRYNVACHCNNGPVNYRQLEKLDGSLLNGIRLRYGSLDKFRKKFKQRLHYPKSPTANKPPIRYTEEAIIASLKKCVETCGHTPTTTNYMNMRCKPSMPTILTRFGSWRKALAAADLI